MAESSGYKSIIRIDQPHKGNHGWQVRVQFLRKQYTKFFSDSFNGGYYAALKKAILYRDDLEYRLGKPRTDRFLFLSKSKKSKGMLGVCLKKQNTFQVVFSPEPGIHKRKTFSIRKYGNKKAYEMACAFRRKMEKEIYGTELPTNKNSRLDLS